MEIRICVLFLIFATAECSRIVRQNAGTVKKDSAKGKTSAAHGDVMEHMFNLYDPSFLALVWPKIANGVHLRLGHFCWEDVSLFFKDLAEGRAWAFNAVDASGRYQGSLFAGNRFWLGSKQECFQLDKDFLMRGDNSSLDDYYDSEYLKEVLERETFYGSRGHEWQQLAHRDEVIQRAVAADNRPPFRLGYNVARVRLNVTKLTMAKSYDIMLGLCLPRSCNIEDIHSIVTFSIMINDNLKSNKTVPRIAKVTSLRQIEEYYNIGADSGALILICITVFLLILCIVATALELNIVKCRLKPHTSRSVSFDLQKYNNTETQKDTTLSRYYDATKKLNDAVWKETSLGKLVVVEKPEDSKDTPPIKNALKPHPAPPTITLDVMCMERATGSCNRCGKYKRQCTNPTQNENLSACPRIKYSSATSVSTIGSRKSFAKRLLLCYSLSYSWRRIFNTSMANKDLSVMHLLRILATLWVIYVHVAVMVSYISEDAGDINDLNNIYYVIVTGTLAFDTLLFVSGLFSAHHFFYLKSHYTVEELVSFGGACGQILQFVCFVTNRIIRLLPSYAYAVLCYGVLARVTHDTAALWLPDGDGETCDRYWWRNLLYVTNMYPAEERCMQVSWYLSAESQLHVVGALACATRAGARGRLVAALILAALLAATATDVSSAYTDYGQYLSGTYEAYSLYIERTCARAVPYFVGVFTGWMVHKTNGRVDISFTAASCLWFASLATIVTSSIAPWLATEWLSAWLHLTWPIALLWPALICATNFAPVARRVLDSGLVAALSRLCYGALLLHAAAAKSLLLVTDTALCSHNVCLWSYFAGTTLLTLLGALLLSLLVEMPCCSLLRRLSDSATM